jgi:hypothetical protein
MKKYKKILMLGFLNHTISVSDRFINKVDTGMARSKETYSDLKQIKEEAELLKEQIIEK